MYEVDNKPFNMRSVLILVGHYHHLAVSATYNKDIEEYRRYGDSQFNSHQGGMETLSSTASKEVWGDDNLSSTAMFQRCCTNLYKDKTAILHINIKPHLLQSIHATNLNVISLVHTPYGNASAWTFSPQLCKQIIMAELSDVSAIL